MKYIYVAVLSSLVTGSLVVYSFGSGHVALNLYRASYILGCKEANQGYVKCLNASIESSDNFAEIFE
jgi:hypothetical protein